MRSRAIIVASAALGIVGAALAIAGIVLIAEPYADADRGDGQGLAATEAEAIANSKARSQFGDWPNSWQPDCEASETTEDGWLVTCALTRQSCGQTRETSGQCSAIRVPQVVTYEIKNDGSARIIGERLRFKDWSSSNP